MKMNLNHIDPLETIIQALPCTSLPVLVVKTVQNSICKFPRQTRILNILNSVSETVRKNVTSIFRPNYM